MIELTVVGYILSATLLGLGFTATAFLEIGWQCGQCGKFNRTKIIKFMLQWCDHQGSFKF